MGDRRRCDPVEARNNNHHLQAPPLIIRGEESYEITAAGRLLSDNVRDPLTDGARILLAEGVDPAEPLVLRHAGSDMDCMTLTVGSAAGLRVLEGYPLRSLHPIPAIRPRRGQPNPVVRRRGRRRYQTAWSTWSHEACTEARSLMQAARMG